MARWGWWDATGCAGASVAGELALVALGEQSGDAAAIAIGVGLIPGGKLMGKFGKFMSGFSVAAWNTAKKYAVKSAKFLWNNSPYGLIHRAAKMLAKGCGCFTPQTMVWTATGLTAIATIQPGDLVFALDEDTGQTSLRMVTEVYEREGDAPLVMVHTSSGELIETTEEHPFLVSGRWMRADQLAMGDELDAAHGCVSVIAVQHTSRLSRVHNLEVEGLHNYRVGDDGVVVHNGNPCDLIIRRAMDVRSALRQAPDYVRKEIKRIDVPSDPRYGQPHVTHNNGSAINWDGSIRDEQRGSPEFSRRVREWLESQGWGK